MPQRPKQSAKSETGQFAKFDSLLRRVIRVPHSKIKAELEREKRAKVSRASRVSSAKG